MKEAMSMKKQVLTGGFLAAALAGAFLTFTPPAVSAVPNVIVGQEESITSDTVTSDKIPTGGPLAPAEAPFSSRDEYKAAGTMQIGDIDVVNYATEVKERVPGKNMIISATISAPEDDVVMSRLADKIYKEHNGSNYENVTILWHVGANPEPAKPWGRTEISRNSTDFAIVRY